MRVAGLYDIHGNLAALEAVLADGRLAEVEAIVVGGDVVAGPQPAEVFDRLLELERVVVVVRGNADRELLEGSDAHGLAWCAHQLGSERLRVVASWPLTAELQVDELGPALFCHATPRSDEDIVTRITPADAIAEEFEGIAPVAVVGHTHVQFDRRIGALRLVNAGSVGMPYEGRRGAFWALVGPAIELCCTDYDVEAAASAFRRTGSPNAEQHAGWLLDPPSPEEATSHFESLRGA